MATPITDEDLDNNQQSNPPPSDTSGPTSISGSSASNGSNKSPSTYNQSAPTSSGSFTNLQNYINANKNSNIAGSITNNVQNQANQTQNDINTSNTNYNNQLNNIGNQFSDSNYVQNTLANPDASQASNFNNYLNAYNNNQQQFNQLQSGLQNYGTLNGEVGNIQQQADLGKTEPGRFQLLKQTFNTPTYNTGQQMLDNLLLQSNPNEEKSLSNLGNISQGLNTNLTNTQNSALANEKNLQNQAQQVQNSTNSALGDKFMGESQYLTNQYDTAVGQRKQQFEDAKTRIMSGNPTEQDISLFQNAGINSGTQTYNALADQNQLNNILSLNDINQGQSATAADYSKLAALQALAQGNTNFNSAASDIYSKYNNPNLAGQASSQPLYNVNAGNFNVAVQNAANAYNAEANPYNTAVSQAEARLNGGDPNFHQGLLQEQQEFAPVLLNTPSGPQQVGTPGDIYGNTQQSIQDKINAENQKYSNSQAALQNLYKKYDTSRTI